MVVTITLMAIIVIPLMASVRTSVKVSSISHSAAQVETAIVNAADRINRAPLRCDYTQYARAAVQTQGWDATRASVTQEWYDPDIDDWVDNGYGCRFASPTADLVQRVAITITSPNGSVSRTIEVVKSNV